MSKQAVEKLIRTYRMSHGEMPMPLLDPFIDRIRELERRCEKLEGLLGSIQGNGFVVSEPDAEAIEKLKL